MILMTSNMYRLRVKESYEVMRVSCLVAPDQRATENAGRQQQRAGESHHVADRSTESRAHSPAPRSTSAMLAAVPTELSMKGHTECERRPSLRHERSREGIMRLSLKIATAIPRSTHVRSGLP